jgi:AraC-like DNA-binding protein
VPARPQASRRHHGFVLTAEDILLTVEDMAVIRGTALSGYPGLVTDLGGNPRRLLRAAGLRATDVGSRDTFISYQGVISAVESAAQSTHTLDFGRRLALRQGIEILGPVGVAARTAANVADALAIFETYMHAYSPVIATRISPGDRPERVRFEFSILIDPLPACPQTIELSLGVALRVFRFLIGTDYSPRLVHLPHQPLTPRHEYRDYFGATPRFGDRFAGFTLRTSDLQCRLDQDEIAHEAVVSYLQSVIGRHHHGLVTPVRELVKQLLPTGHATLDVVAAQVRLHPKTLQRRLADESTNFNAVVDEVRKHTAERLLRDTEIALSHLSLELGYAEQSVLSRSCRRWFGRGPAAHRAFLNQNPDPSHP